MPKVEPQTEALHFFRAAQALVLSLLGTALVVLAVPTLTTNYLWTTFTAIASIFVIVPSTLAVRRARRDRPQEPSLYYRALRLRWSLLQVVLVIAVVLAAKFPFSLELHTGHLILGVGAIYVAAAAVILRFVPFYFVAAAVLLAAIVPFHLSQPAVGFLITGLLFWMGSFLVFSRSTQ
jgi:hypothetical protein